MYRKKPKILENSNGKNKSTNFYNSKELINNNQELSIGIFPEEVEEINIKELYKALVRRKKIIFFTSGLFFSLAVLTSTYERVVNPLYRGSFSILIKDPIEIADSTSSLVGSQQGAPPPILNLFMSASTGKFPNLVALLKSPMVLGDLAANNNLSVGALSSKISIDMAEINQLTADGVIQVGLVSDDPKKGYLLLNDLKDVYLKAAINQKQIKLKEGLDFLNSQYPTIENKNILLRKKLADFQEKYSLLQPIAEANDLKSKQKAMDDIIVNKKLGLERLTKVRKDLLAGKISAIEFKKTLSSGPDDIFAILDVDQALLSQQIEIEKQLSLDRTIFKPDSKVIKSLIARKEELDPIFLKSQLKSIKMVIDKTKAEMKIYEAKRDDLENKFLTKPSLINEYQTIKDNIKLSKASLLSIKSAQEKFRLDLAEKNVKWKLLDPPVMSSVPFKPNIKFNITLSLLFGTFFGSILALLRDRIDNKFYSSNMVEDYLKNNFLGHISYPSLYNDLDNNMNLSNDQIKAINQVKTNQGESKINNDPFRNIYSSLLSFKKLIGIKSISILSTDYEECASSLNIGLARSLSDIGKNVLLVDFDFRSNEINDKLEINNSKGLSDLILEDTYTIKDLILEVKSLKFRILSSGSNIKDPVNLLGSDKIYKVVSELNNIEEFDYIIYNTTPIASASDALIFSEKIDGFIYNVSLNKIDRNYVKENYKKASLSQFNILGIMTNEVEMPLITYNYQSFLGLEKIEEYLKSFIKKTNNRNVMKLSKALISIFKASKKFTRYLIN